MAKRLHSSADKLRNFKANQLIDELKRRVLIYNKLAAAGGESKDNFMLLFVNLPINEYSEVGEDTRLNCENKPATHQACQLFIGDTETLSFAGRHLQNQLLAEIVRTGGGGNREAALLAGGEMN